MFAKEANPRKSRVLNSPIKQYSNRKNALVQTENSGRLYFPTDEFLIKSGGEISTGAYQNYKKAVDYINKWNCLMNEYLKVKINTKISGDGNLTITNIPNQMSFFIALTKKVENLRRKILERKTSSTQTFTETPVISNSMKSKLSKSSSKSKNYLLPDIGEDLSDIENNIPNMTKNIQESQYRNYPPKPPYSLIPLGRQNTTLKHTSKDLDIQKRSQSARSLEEKIIQKVRSNTSSKTLDKIESRASLSLDYRARKSCNVNSTTSIRKYQNFPKTSSSPSSPSVILQTSQTASGLLSPNGMIASEINARGTPIIVKNMFEEIRNPFMSEGNILKYISKSQESSDSSVILTDKESKELKLSDQVLVDRNRRDYCDENSCQHPLNLNERDLNATDKDFINSIGIFTAAGELKANAMNYLQKKDDVKKGVFRNQRIPRMHTVRKHKNDSFRSDSISDTLSQSSGIRSDN